MGLNTKLNMGSVGDVSHICIQDIQWSMTLVYVSSCEVARAILLQLPS